MNSSAKRTATISSLATEGNLPGFIEHPVCEKQGCNLGNACAHYSLAVD